MLDFQAVLFAELDALEGKINYLYLDTHQPPLPTTARGVALSLAESLTLPWQKSGRAASQADIRSDWARVTGMAGGMLAYRYYNAVALTLPDDAVNALTQKRFDQFTSQLTGLFPSFMSWPVEAKAATLDMVYGLGIGLPASPGRKATGLRSYPMFCSAASRRDWTTCAAQCAMNVGDTAYDKRNQWLKAMFLRAAQGK